MHELMVKSLPRQCRLTAIFDVSQINDMIWHMSTLMMLCSLVILGRFLVHHSLMLHHVCGFLTTDHIQDLPYVVCKLLFPDRSESP